MANNISFSHKKILQFLHSVETLSSDLYHDTANELRYNISKFSLPVNVTGEQFKQSNRDFNKDGIILTDNTCHHTMQWLPVHILDAVFIQAITSTVFPVIGITLSVQTSAHLQITANKMQLFLSLFIFTDALHVSDGSSAHHQEHITVHTASGIVSQ